MHLQLKKNKKWAEMLDALPENDVRYAVIDIFYDTTKVHMQKFSLLHGHRILQQSNGKCYVHQAKML